jgi:serine/threonine-protein kinase
LPDGENVLFSIRYSAGIPYQIAVLSLETKEQKTLLANGRQAHYLPTGHLVYELSVTGNLMAVPFDLARLEVTGEPVPIVEGVRQVGSSFVDYAVSQEGTLVYVPAGGGSAENSLVWVDRKGTEHLVTEAKRAYTNPRLSSDGKRIALSFFEDDERHAWIYDIERESFSRLTFEGLINTPLTWTPDGNWITFRSDRDGQQNLYHKAADGSGPAERLTTTQNSQIPTSWSPDGKVLAFYEWGPNAPRDIWLLPMEGERKPQLVISSPNVDCCARFSPDGQWLAYVSTETGRRHVYVRPYPETRGKWLVSGEEGGGEPVWSPDGTELFYRSGSQMERMMAVFIHTEPTFSSETPRVLFEGSYQRSAASPGDNPYYDISPDGQRFLMIKREQQAGTQINVVLNWFEELKRLVPTP